MATESWENIAARLSPHAPEDLADLTAPAGKRPAPGGWLPRHGAAPAAPAGLLWNGPGSGRAAIGVRVGAPVSGVAQAAARLVAIAAERGVQPIILSCLPVSGFERFGFRTERLCGESEAETKACEEELMRFWDIGIVIDIEQIQAMS